MATITQLRAERYWDREIVTPELDELADRLCSLTGRPRVAAGTKGNIAHLNGSHRSQEWIEQSRYCTNHSYTVQGNLTAEQKRHIAGLDFTPGQWGTAANRRLMAAQTGRLIAALKAGRLPGVREVIGTIDGRTVIRVRSDGTTGSGDISHLDHWHLGLDRRHARDETLMARILATALGIDLETNMTASEFLAILRNPTVTPTLRALAWQYSGGGIPSGMSTLGVLNEILLNGRALLAAQAGANAEEILAEIRRVGEEVAARDTADAQRDAELLALVRQGQDGTADAAVVIRRIAEVLAASGAPDPGQVG